MKKRFWEKAEVVDVKGGFAVHLDTRPLLTPAKVLLVLPTCALAEMVAAEWQAQAEKINPTTMPATRMANAAIDKVNAGFDEVAGMIAGYGDSDLLCYRATAPAELVMRQAELWQPLLDWAASDLGARLRPVSSIMHSPQDKAALATLAARVHALTMFELAAFHDLVAISGSLIIGFATVNSLLGLEELWSRACLDELWQEQTWGRDEDSFALREQKKRDFFGAARFYALSNNAIG